MQQISRAWREIWKYFGTHASLLKYPTNLSPLLTGIFKATTSVRRDLWEGPTQVHRALVSSFVICCIRAKLSKMTVGIKRQGNYSSGLQNYATNIQSSLTGTLHQSWGHWTSGPLRSHEPESLRNPGNWETLSLRTSNGLLRSQDDGNPGCCQKHVWFRIEFFQNWHSPVQCFHFSKWTHSDKKKKNCFVQCFSDQLY